MARHQMRTTEKVHTMVF